MQYFTATQAAEMIGVSEKTIRRWINEGKLAAHHVAKNRLAIAGDDIERIRRERPKYSSGNASGMSELTKRVEQLEYNFDNRFSKRDIVPSSIPQHRRQSGSMGADVSTIRKFNRQLILNHLRKRGPMSQVVIAEELRLSRTAVSSLIDELKRENLVYEGEKLDARTDRRPGGRRATSIHFNANAGYVIGVDIDRTHLTIHLINLAAETINEWSGPFNMSRFGGEAGLEFVAEKIRDLVTGPVTWSQVRGIGLASPGSLDPDCRMLVSPPLLSGWLNIDIPDFLRHKLTLNQNIPIYLGEDGNTGALGESRYGKGRGIANMVYIKVGTGIGAGLILNGQLYVGSGGVAGEIGHMLVEDGGPRCPSCGKVGCLEALAAERAIVEDARNEANLLPLSTLASYTGALAIADVLRKADEGDPACRAALERAGKRVGRVIGNMLNIYNPSMVLLDGDVVRIREHGVIRLNKIFLAALSKSAKDVTLPAAWEGTKILVAHLNNAIALGAAAIAIDNDKEFGIDSVSPISAE